MNRLRLERVQYLPKELSSGVLYVSEEYAVAGHLCACGCGSKVVTPLGPAEWTFSEHNGQPTLRPSIGNWQLPCRSHYVISDGAIRWAGDWSDAQVEAGHRSEQRRREAFYAERGGQRGLWARFVSWLRGLFKR